MYIGSNCPKKLIEVLFSKVLKIKLDFNLWLSAIKPMLSQYVNNLFPKKM